jgi:hypothetical protein
MFYFFEDTYIYRHLLVCRFDVVRTEKLFGVVVTLTIG